MRLAILVALTAIMAMMMSRSAVAAEDDLMLSRDAANWTNTLEQPLYDEGDRWVPAESRTVSFFMRNQADSAGDLTVMAKTNGATALLNDLVFEARAGSQPWAELDGSGPARRLNTDSIPLGSVVPVTIRTTFVAGSGNDTQELSASLRLVVSLTASTADTTEADRLPSTGSAITGWQVWAGAVLVGIGAALFAARQRIKSKEESHV